MIPKPNTAIINDDRSVRLDFEDTTKNGNFRTVGSVTWPMLIPGRGMAQGYILQAAQKLDTGNIIVFENTSWSFVTNILNQADGSVEHMGLCEWFPGIWYRYKCRSFYQWQDEETSRTYRLQVYRQRYLLPQPSFVNAFIPNMEEAINLLYHLRTNGKLYLDLDGEIVKDLKTWEGLDRKPIMPSVMALLCLVTALERYPWRSRKE